jgi:hypothetical protein
MHLPAVLHSPASHSSNSVCPCPNRETWQDVAIQKSRCAQGVVASDAHCSSTNKESRLQRYVVHMQQRNMEQTQQPKEKPAIVHHVSVQFKRFCSVVNKVIPQQPPPQKHPFIHILNTKQHAGLSGQDECHNESIQRQRFSENHTQDHRDVHLWWGKWGAQRPPYKIQVSVHKSKNHNAKPQRQHRYEVLIKTTTTQRK